METIVNVRCDQEVSVTAGVSLTGDETNKIAAAFPPAIEGKGPILAMEVRALHDDGICERSV
jgi:hypothetical protein